MTSETDESDTESDATGDETAESDRTAEPVERAERSEAGDGVRPQAGDVATLAAPEAELSEKRVVTGGEFEREFQLSRDATASFLHDLADEIASEKRVTVGNERWELPFEYGEPIEVEIEHEGDDSRELEIEVELAWASDGDALEVR